MPPTRIATAATSFTVSSALALVSTLSVMCFCRDAARFLRFVQGPRVSNGRPGGNRTPNLRFWRPPLCQLSYWPMRANLSTCRWTGLLGLLQDLRDDAGADGAAALADRKAQALFHRDRADQLDRHLDVVARHHHLDALRQLHRTRHVRRAEVKLRPIALEERRVTPALLLRQHVHLALELGVRRDRARLRQHLATLHFLALRAAQQHAHVVARLPLVEQLAEHLDARAGGLERRAQPHDLDFVVHLHDAALDAARHHRAAA